MKKPWWDETWELNADDPESGPVIGLKDGGVLFECNDATRARGAHAAPDIARVLLKILATERDDSGHLYVQFDDEDGLVAALAKAGVLP